VAIRREKELKMDKERPKVKSLEEYKPTTILNDNLKFSSPRPPSRLTTRLACYEYPGLGR
jgi:hypothetical protein